MFERYTERARQVVVLAQEGARDLKHDYIGTEHILLGLICEAEGLAARVLEGRDISEERVKAQIVRIIGTGEKAVDGQVPFTPRAKRVLEVALREALSLGHNYIGTEHILLAMLREGVDQGVAARILRDFLGGNYAEELRNEVTRMLSGPRRKQQQSQSFIAKQESRVPTYEDCRNLLGKVRVRHNKYPDLAGLLTGYDWNDDRVKVTFVAYPEVIGYFSASRKEVIIDDRISTSPGPLVA